MCDVYTDVLCQCICVCVLVCDGTGGLGIARPGRVSTASAASYVARSRLGKKSASNDHDYL